MGAMNTFSGLLSRKVVLGATVAAALFFMVVGIIFWGGFNTAMEATNTLEFCISCHEMEENVYQEYSHTVHYTNRSGVRATCSDCHVPDPWIHKMIRKIQASGEVFHKIMGSVDTPEKFDAKRLKLAKRVWNTMKTTDSRECRNCHDFGTMNPANQKPRAQKQHINAMEQGGTCIDCHKGIAHKKAHDQLSDEEFDALAKPNPKFIRPMPPQWRAFLEQEAAAAAAPQEGGHQERNRHRGGQETAAAAPTAPSAAPAAATGSAMDWSDVPSRKVTLFYPGQTSMEWVLNGRDHGGARPFKAGDRCTACHDKETADMGKKMVTGEKAETTPIPGKRASIPVTVQAAHDGSNLYMRFQWADTPHVPVPNVAGGKMDADNPMKLALMFATDEVEYADRAGCWGTCHHDLRSMPDAPKDKEATKYISESRTEIDLKGGDGKPRGGWDKRKSDADIQAELAANHFMDLVRYKSGKGEAEDGHILADRVMTGGQGATFTASLDNGTWTVEMKRPLKSDKPGDLTLASDQVYNFGFAIHDDFSNARFHHVSLGYKLGFDNAEAEINAARQ